MLEKNKKVHNHPPVTKEQEVAVKDLLVGLMKFVLNGGSPYTVSQGVHRHYVNEQLAEQLGTEFIEDAKGGPISVTIDGKTTGGWLYVNGESGYGKTDYAATLAVVTDETGYEQKIWEIYSDGSVEVLGYKFDWTTDEFEQPVDLSSTTHIEWLDAEGVNKLNTELQTLEHGWPELTET